MVELTRQFMSLSQLRTPPALKDDRSTDKLDTMKSDLGEIIRKKTTSVPSSTSDAKENNPGQDVQADTVEENNDKENLSRD